MTHVSGCDSVARKTVLFFSCEPGGAEVLIPVIDLLKRETRHDIVVTSYGFGLERFVGRKVKCVEIGPIQKDDAALLTTYRPDMVITSATSLPTRDMSEKYLWKAARRSAIPTFAFLDQWQNYAVRFSGPTPDERLAYLPDYINCINDIGETEMVREGFDANMLVKFGHPYLSSLEEYARAVDLTEIRRRLNVGPSERIVLFVSEAIREHYGQSRGYDQYDALTVFLDLVSKSNTKVRPLVKLHPKDTAAEFELLLHRYQDLNPILVKDELSPEECIQVSDVVYGMTSIMLIEAFVLGKKVTSLQPGLRADDAMVLSRTGFIRKFTAKKISETDTTTLDVLSPDVDFAYAFKSREFLSFVARMLNDSGAHS